MDNMFLMFFIFIIVYGVPFFIGLNNLSMLEKILEERKEKSLSYYFHKTLFYFLITIIALLVIIVALLFKIAYHI